MEATHLCMSMRGVEKQNSVAATSAMLGVFREDARTRMEFLELIKRPEMISRGSGMLTREACVAMLRAGGSGVVALLSPAANGYQPDGRSFRLQRRTDKRTRTAARSPAIGRKACLAKVSVSARVARNWRDRTVTC